MAPLYKRHGSCCVAVGCSMRSGMNDLCKIQTFTFPRDPKRREAWINAVRREGWKPSNSSRLCSRHFISGKPVSDPNHPDWVPSIFNFRPSNVVKRTQALARFERIQRRRTTANHKDNEALHSNISLSEEEVIPEGNSVDNQETMTEVTMVNISALVEEIQFLKKKNEILRKQNEDLINQTELLKNQIIAHKHQYNLISSIADNNCFAKRIIESTSPGIIKFYTGLENIQIFWSLVNFFASFWKPRRPVRLEFWEQLLLILVKLRLALLNKDLAFRFNVSQSVVSFILNEWMPVMASNLNKLIVWPSKTLIKKNLPKCMESFTNVRCIIDCSEVFIERPKRLIPRAQTYSQYKKHNTIKFLIAVTPSGSVSFVSKTWGGRVSDKQLTTESGFLDLLQPGDAVMADRGFQINELLAFKGARLIIPAFTKGLKQLSGETVTVGRKISSARVHVERAIGRIKNYRILQSVLPITYLKNKNNSCMADNIITVIGALCNLRNPLINQK